MLHPILETDWLSELSDAQQEIIAGGGQLSDINKKILTGFEASNTVFRNTVKSGPQGSYVDTSIDNMFVNTTANEELTALFDGALNGAANTTDSALHGVNIDL
jgi:hypothetical protein